MPLTSPICNDKTLISVRTTFIEESNRKLCLAVWLFHESTSLPIHVEAKVRSKGAPEYTTEQASMLDLTNVMLDK